MAERRVLQFDHCDDQTRFEIEIVQELRQKKRQITRKTAAKSKQS